MSFTSGDVHIMAVVAALTAAVAVLAAVHWMKPPRQ